MLHIPDQTDLDILRLLQHNAHLSYREIAIITHKSPSIVSDRIKRLKKEGYIKQIVAVLNDKILNRWLFIFSFVRLNTYDQNLMLIFEKDVVKFNEVIETYHIAGEYDYLLKVQVNNMDGYNDFIIECLSTFSQIKSMSTLFVMKELKRDHEYPLTGKNLSP